MLLGACADASATSDPATDPTAGSDRAPLPLTIRGSILHAGDYCKFLQVAAPGNNTLPVINGCVFNVTKPADLFATDGGDYSVSEVVGTAEMGVRGPADARVMIVCRLSPRAQFWFWISSDGHWNIDSVSDVHRPVDLVGADQSEPMRQYIKAGGPLNAVQFKCAGGPTHRTVALSLNVNGHHFAALSVAMPEIATPLARPSTPWFVDVGARLTSPGTLEGTVAKVTLYDRE